MSVSGLNTTASNSGTMTPGSKVPRDPPLEAEGQLENSLAACANDLPSAICLATTSASSCVSTRMCEAVARRSSNFSLAKAALKKSNIPIERDEEDEDEEVVVRTRGAVENACVVETVNANRMNAIRKRKGMVVILRDGSGEGIQLL
jgi:hypothetical protein